MKLSRNHISPFIREVSNPTRMTIKFSVSSAVAPKAWEHLLEAMNEFEKLYQVALADLDIKSIPADKAI